MLQTWISWIKKTTNYENMLNESNSPEKVNKPDVGAEVAGFSPNLNAGALPAVEDPDEPKTPVAFFAGAPSSTSECQRKGVSIYNCSQWQNMTEVMHFQPALSGFWWLEFHNP